MTTPANIAPVSLADIAAMLENATAKRDAVLLAEMSALREEVREEMRKRDAEVAEYRKEAVERDAKAAERETRLVKWFGTAMGVAAGGVALVIVAVSVGFGVWLELRDSAAVSPVTINIPPAIHAPAPRGGQGGG